MVQVHFNVLPYDVRTRLIRVLSGAEPRTFMLAFDQDSTGTRVSFLIVALLALGALYAVLARDFGVLGGGSRSAVAGLVGGIVLIFVALAAIARSLASRLWRAHCPIDRGRYLMPLDLVDASRLPMLDIFVWSELTNVRILAPPQANRMNLVFEFAGGVRQSIPVTNLDHARDIVKRIEEARQQVRDAIAKRDPVRLAALDPFTELRQNGRVVTGDSTVLDSGDGPYSYRTPSMWLARPALIAAVIAVPIGYACWYGRNLLNDEAIFSAARKADVESAYESYLSEGSRHAALVRSDLMPRAALPAAQKNATVTALRAFLQKYPNSVVDAEARESLHRVFAGAREAYAKSASDDPATRVFVSRLLDASEKSGSSTVLVRFSPPATADLKAMDASKMRVPDPLNPFGFATVSVAPVAPHFTAEANRKRETAIVTALGRAFARVFPADVVSLAYATGPEPASPAATVSVRYSISPSGATYTSENIFSRSSAYIGVQFSFDVLMTIPGAAETLRNTLTVKPPKKFTVSHAAPVGTLESPSDSNVYDTMALRAFDELVQALQKVFFKDSGVKR